MGRRVITLEELIWEKMQLRVVARVEEDGIKIVSARTTEDPEALAVQIDRRLDKVLG